MNNVSDAPKNGASARILALDTSGQHASAAILANTRVACVRHNKAQIDIIGEISLNARHGDRAYTHSEILMPTVEKLFKLTGQKTEELTHIAYTCGPGSFTGLRIGASTALGLAKALNIKAIAVPTLDALAYNAVGIGYKGDICPVMDARRGQVYFALFDSGFNKMLDYAAITVDELFSRLRSDTLIIGDGATAMHNLYSTTPNENKSKFLDFAASHHNFVRAASVGLWACSNLDGECGKMIYVRQPQAVREASDGN